MSINATLFVQCIVFLILVLFTMKYVWPPVAKALDDRALKIADGLAAADKAQLELVAVNKRVEQELSKVNDEANLRISDAEKRAILIIQEARLKADEEAKKIIASAFEEAKQQSLLARETLREEVVILAVKGAEQILRKEIDLKAHVEMLERLKLKL